MAANHRAGRQGRRRQDHHLRHAHRVPLPEEERPVLAVDADANSNLNEVLGVEVNTTLGEIREEIARAEMAAKSPIPPGMSKADYAEMQFSDALTEADDYDLLVMGRTQGKGCYCFVNGLLSTQVAKYAQNYRYIVVDNEAGLEHLSRGILPKVDTILTRDLVSPAGACRPPAVSMR